MHLETIFGNHHRLLDRLYNDIQAYIGAADRGSAMSAFSDFHATIERHMCAEEEILFPAYEEVNGNDNPLTGILRKGHTDLRSFFDEIGEAIDIGDQEEAAALIGTTGQILLHHNTKEEEELYPAVASLLPQAAIDAAASKLESSS